MKLFWFTLPSKDIVFPNYQPTYPRTVSTRETVNWRKLPSKRKKSFNLNPRRTRPEFWIYENDFVSKLELEIQFSGNWDRYSDTYLSLSDSWPISPIARKSFSPLILSRFGFFSEPRLKCSTLSFPGKIETRPNRETERWLTLFDLGLYQVSLLPFWCNQGQGQGGGEERKSCRRPFLAYKFRGLFWYQGRFANQTWGSFACYILHKVSEANTQFKPFKIWVGPCLIFYPS